MSSPPRDQGTGARLVRDAYDAVVRALDPVDDDASWTPTGCAGWAVRDLTFHCLADAQRALVALHTPSGDPADRDAVTYWSDWAPDPAGAAQGRRFVRVGTSMFLVWDQLRGLHAETAEAVVHAAAAAAPAGLVRTQGHTLSADDLLRTLCVEATIHHLDLVRHLPDAEGPPASGLREVRRVLDGLLGGPPDVGWDDERYALVATGRARPTADEATALGATIDLLPVFS